MNKPLANRVYRHYKGDYYLVKGIVKHSETGEEMVLYQGLYENGPLWVRPLSLFVDKIDRKKHPNIKQEHRFELQEIKSKRQGE